MTDAEKYFTKLQDGELVVKTLAQSGEIIPEEAKDPSKYFTALVQTEDGPQLAVKTFSVAGGGSSITVDDALSSSSENPVQNKVITSALSDKQDTLTAGTGISIQNNVISNTVSPITVDDELSLSSENPVQNKVITAALNAKQDKLDGTVYTTDNLIEGTNISITQVPAPVIDEHTLALWNFESGVNDVIHNIAANTNYGDGTPSQSATKKFGEYGGVGSARLVYNLSSVLPAGTKQLTLDWWEYSTSSDNSFGELYLCNYTNINNRPSVVGINGGDYYFYVNSQSQYLGSSMGSFPKETWMHRCLTVDSETGVGKYYQNGNLIATLTVTPFSISATNFSLLINSSWNKVYDEIRVSDVIRWDSNFTPWDEPYTQGGNAVYQINNTQTPSLTWYSGTRGNTLTIADTSAAKLVKIYKNGILLQPSADYTISGTTLTMDVSLVETDKIALEVI